MQFACGHQHHVAEFARLTEIRAALVDEVVAIEARADIVIAAHGGDHAIYPDCREDFMRAMGTTMRLGTYANIQLLRPFINLTKGAIVTTGSHLGIDFAQTWSCYKGGERHCGQCGTCVERREAFAQAATIDPTNYLSNAPLPAPPQTTPRAPSC